MSPELVRLLITSLLLFTETGEAAGYVGAVPHVGDRKALSQDLFTPAQVHSLVFPQERSLLIEGSADGRNARRQ